MHLIHELADMHLIHELAEGNVRTTERLDHERHNESEPRVSRTFSIEQNVLDTVRMNPRTSVRVIAAAVV
ncbi:hypothetical protein TNCV_5032711 [Trichonephila clavipes]|nr:hypothetical protein TNCV_5032711 [Trichonephila clavipes]